MEERRRHYVSTDLGRVGKDDGAVRVERWSPTRQTLSYSGHSKIILLVYEIVSLREDPVFCRSKGGVVTSILRNHIRERRRSRNVGLKICLPRRILSPFRSKTTDGGGKTRVEGRGYGGHKSVEEVGHLRTVLSST